MSASAAGTITFDDFLKVDIRVGTVLSAAPNVAARKPALVLIETPSNPLMRVSDIRVIADKATSG